MMTMRQQKKYGYVVYKQLKKLKTIKHPLTGQEIKITRRTCGMLRREEYLLAIHLPNPLTPIPEAPKKQSQLDAESYHKKFEAELCGKAKSPHQTKAQRVCQTKSWEHWAQKFELYTTF